MSPEVIARRELAPISSQAACLAGYVLRFSQPGFAITEPAFANLEPEESGVVYGVLHELSGADKDRLDSIEGAQYLNLELEVEIDAGPKVIAQVYINPHPERGRIPSRRYLTLLVNGANHYGLPDPYVDGLQAHRSRYIPVLSELTGKMMGSIERLRSMGLRTERIGMWVQSQKSRLRR